MNIRQVIIQHVFWRGMYFFSAFILNILISRFFKADGSGWIYYLINNLSFLLLIISLSLESGFAYYASKAEINLSKTGFFCIVWSLLASLIGLVVLKWVIPVSHPEFLIKSEYILSAACYTLGVLLTTYFVALFFARQIFILPNLILLSVNILLVILILVFRRNGSLLNNFVLIYFISFLVQGFLLAIAFFINTRGRTGLGYPAGIELGKVFRYSLLALVVNIVFFLVYRVDYWFVRKFCSLTDLGNYIQVSKIGQVLIILPSILASTIFPLVSGGQKEEVQKLLGVITRLLLTGIGIICVILSVVGNWLFPFVFGRSFSEMYTLFLFLSPGILALAAHYPLTAYFAGKKMIRVNIKGACFALTIIITGDLLLIPVMGVKAASLVSSMGYLIYYLYVLFVFKSTNPTPLIDFFVMRKSDINFFKKILHEKK